MALAGGNSIKRPGWSKLDASFPGNLDDSILSFGWIKLRTNDLYVMSKNTYLFSQKFGAWTFTRIAAMCSIRLLLAESQAGRHARYPDHAARTARPSITWVNLPGALEISRMGFVYENWRTTSQECVRSVLLNCTSYSVPFGNIEMCITWLTETMQLARKILCCQRSPANIPRPLKLV